MSASPSKPRKTNSKAQPAPSYAALQSELDTVLLELQREDLDVDDALRYYQQGLQLVRQLEQYLQTAQNTITELQAKAAPASS